MLHGISYGNWEIAEGDKVGLCADAPVPGATIPFPAHHRLKSHGKCDVTVTVPQEAADWIAKN